MFSLRHRSVRSSCSSLTMLLLFAAVIASFHVLGIISSVGAEELLVSESVRENNITLLLNNDKSFTFTAIRPEDGCLGNDPDANSITFSYGDNNCEMGLKWHKLYVLLLVDGVESYGAMLTGKNSRFEVIIKGAESSLAPDGKKFANGKEPCKVNFKKLPSGEYSVDFAMTRVKSGCDIKVEFGYPKHQPLAYKPTDSNEKNTQPPGPIKETHSGSADIGTTDLTTADEIAKSELSKWIWLGPLIAVIFLLLVGGVFFFFYKIRSKRKKPVDIDFVNREADEGSSSQDQSEGIVARKDERKHKSLPLRRPHSDNAKPVEVRSVRAVALPADSDDVVVSMESNKGKKQQQFNYQKDFVETPAPVGWSPAPKKQQKKVKGYVPQPPVNYQKDFVQTPAPVGWSPGPN